MIETVLKGMGLCAQQVAILYTIVAVGVVADRMGLFTEKTARKCTDLLFYIVVPAKIIESFFTLDYSPEIAKKLLMAFGCALLMFGVSIGISAFTFRKTPDDVSGIYKFASAYGNCGYFGLPLVSALAGDEGVLYSSAVIIAVQIFSFTHGIAIMNKGKEEKPKFNVQGLIRNPGVFAVIVGLPLFLLPVNIPAVVTTPVSYLASLNTPLAMLIFGTYMSHANLRSTFKNRNIPLVALLKLLVLPLVMLGAYKLFGFSGALLSSMVISASAPPANNTVLFAAKYDRDTGLASTVVSSVSLMSIVTIPLITGIAYAL